MLHSYATLVNRLQSSRTDWIQPLCIGLLGIMGLFFIYSSQAYTEGAFWKKQIIWLILGGGIYTLLSCIHYRLFLENALYIFLASLILLTLLWTPLGVERYNSTRWLNFFFFTFQPSEAAKIGSLVMVSSILARSEIGDLKNATLTLIKVFVVVSIPIVLIFLQPDLGSALVFPPMVFSLLFISRLSLRFFAAVFVVFVVFMTVLSADIYSYYNYLKVNEISAYDYGQNRGYEEQEIFPLLRNYQRNRILAFVAPEAIDPKGIEASWNLRQSLISVGSGGFLGKGWKEGTQAKLGYLPQSVAHNDFIFSVLAEEKGFVGSMFVIGIFAIILGNGIRIAEMARDRFGMLLATGVTIIFLVHVFVNIGMTIGLMPITGLPLPFVSYGGSFILSCCILQGLIQSVYRYRRDFS